MKDDESRLAEILGSSSQLVLSGSVSALMHSEKGLDSPFMRDIPLGRQTIVGMRYQGGAYDLIDDLHPGSRISFVREPDNAFDDRAVMALDDQDRKLGYIPRRENRIMSMLMDAGKVFYGVIPDIPREEYAYWSKNPRRIGPSGEIPLIIVMDFYMREFGVPEEMVRMPRHGSGGSYALVYVRPGPSGSETGDSSLRGLYAIKVINGEERGQFISNNSEEELASFQKFVGQLPIVSHGITGRRLRCLENAYGVVLGRPFSNQVIDTKVMAENHFPSEKDYSLDHLADVLRLKTAGGIWPERQCRMTWELYRRMDRSEL